MKAQLILKLSSPVGTLATVYNNLFTFRTKCK